MIKINYIKTRQFRDISIETSDQDASFSFLLNTVQEILAFNANYTHTIRKSPRGDTGFILYFIEQKEKTKRQLRDRERLLIEYIFKAEVYND